ncbi:DUF4150 domain-containing protein [Motiliproteus sp. MSK22-1]|uniref:DUF4150 domain-containing protein n=1 Tax=Motiliproteus sp. MSK22-1 TaxID=1897630 RepID=UPI0009755962|nr:DUF4150 domain-containing protein [Motiliproteus sp. MSK22-1]OMH25756.1 hypothetical protein BGP75_24830 [Motiliproteus sp. MSK22-1]
MADEFAARADGKYLVICSTPDVCKVPNVGPVPFPVTETLDNTTKLSKTTRFNGNWAVLLKSHTTKVTGDQAGVAKGVKSGSVGSKAEPLEHSKSVKIEGSWLVRVGDKVHMNKKNTIGTVVFAPAPQQGAITDTGEIDV